MTYYVCLTDKCRAGARSHGTLQLVENVARQVEQSQQLVGLDQMSPTRYLKRGLGKSYRLLGYRWDVNASDSVIVLEAVLPRGSTDYEHFLKGYQSPDYSPTFATMSEDEARAYYSQRTTKEPLPPRQEMSERERSWLYGVAPERLEEETTLVLETADWVKAVKQDSAREMLGLYHQMLESIDLQKLPASEETQLVKILRSGAGSLAIAYAYWPHLHRLLLLEPLTEYTQKHSTTTDWSKYLVPSPQLDELGRVALRSYPFLMTLDRSAWFAIEKDEAANLALSPEESDLLEALRGAGIGSLPGYPLFINGRAGSGKSTMLQYLVSDYVEFAVTNNMAVVPLYMACSSDLLSNARANVLRYLTTHHARLLAGGSELERRKAILAEVLKKGFVVFHEHLYSLLDDVHRARFARDRYVDYSVFRTLWHEDYSRRQHAHRVNAEIAWHVLRTYIKGSRASLDDDFSPAEYEALPKKRRTVPVGTFNMIYEDVWQGWYQRLCEEDEHWDDQDLAAALLQQGGLHATSPVLFSDEAQDFTPIELGLILQMSIYSNRALTPEDMMRVPIAFAGDPLQTINPTGFRWAGIEAMFHDQFTGLLDPRRRGTIDINHKELTYNYRSQRNIVYFCNLLQLVRSVYFDADVSKPQDAWSVLAEHGVPTQWFDPSVLSTSEQLAAQADFVKIVNCEAGEESDLAQKDDILARLPRQRETNVYRNVLSPARAKGLEFDVVVLYKFADSAPKGLAEILAGVRPPPEDPEERLPYEYFLNRLYVAASRAKKRLIIVDSRAARDVFWRFATDTSAGERLSSGMKNPVEWVGRLAYLLDGHDDLSGEHIEAGQQAGEYEARGRQLRDSYLLRQACLAYQSTGEQFKAYLCLGLAHEFEKDYQRAGDAYEKASKPEEAIRCYWMARDYRAVVDVRTDATSPEQRASDFMSRIPSDAATIDFLDHVKQWFVDAAIPEVATDASWQAVLAELLRRLSVMRDLGLATAQSALSVCERAEREGVAVDPAAFAAIAFRAGSNFRAVSLWDSLGLTDTAEYRRARSRIEPFPRNIEWLARGREHDRVIDEWRANATGPGAAPEETLRMVIESALQRNEIALAVELLASTPKASQGAQALTKAATIGDSALIVKAAVTLVRAYVREREWDAAITSAETAEFGKVPRADAVASKLKPHRDSLLSAVVTELAIAADVSSDQKGNPAVAEFLMRNFVARRAATRGLLPVRVIGAAFERAGRFINALQYYEAVFDDQTYTQEDRFFAAVRMIKINERLADHSRRTGDAKYAEDRMRRATQMRDTIKGAGAGHLLAVELPEFPAVDATALGREVLVRGARQWTESGYAFTRVPGHKKLRIESVERGELLTLDVSGRELSGETPVSLVSSEDGTSTWSVPAWSCHLLLRGDGDSHTIEVKSPLGTVVVEFGVT